MARHWKWVIAIAILAVLSASLSNNVFAETNSTAIPQWVKGVAGLWVQGQLTDSDFQQCVQFLVDTGIIQVHDATTITPGLQIEFGSSNSTQIVFSYSNQTNPSIAAPAEFNLDDLKKAANQWYAGTISDQQYFDEVQAAINAGEFGPFDGPQSDKGKTFHEQVDNNNPVDHTVNLSEYYNDGEITIPLGDGIEWVNDMNQTHTITSGTKETGYDGMFFDRSLYAGAETGYRFESPGDFNFFSNYGWDDLKMTVHVVATYKDAPYPKELKDISSAWAQDGMQQGMTESNFLASINQLYKLGFVNNSQGN